MEIENQKCPKCKSKNYEFAEVVENILFSTVENGGITSDYATTGNHIKYFISCCECNHEWTPRKKPSLDKNKTK